MRKLVHKPGAALKTQDVSLHLLKANDLVADIIRRDMKANRTLLVNLVSSPGSGKTALLEATIERLAGAYNLAVLEGDLETERDAQRIRARGVPALQIITGGVCHLEAQMIHQALPEMDLEHTDILFIENVGNLVCPASYDLGEDVRIVLLSVSEGDDKPKKYPSMFLTSDVMLITKADLLPHVSFSIQAVTRDAMEVNPSIRVFPLSTATDEGMNAWCDWLIAEVAKKRYEAKTRRSWIT